MRNELSLESQKEALIQDAEKRILRNVGLSMEDLNKYERILDLGSHQSNLERAAQLRGHNNVISLERNIRAVETYTAPDIKPTHLIHSDAAKMPFPKETFDLIIMHGVPQISRYQDMGLSEFKETLETLKTKGQMRIYPAYLEFIYNQNGGLELWKRLMELKMKSTNNDREIKDIGRKLKVIYQKSVRETMQFFQTHNFNIKLERNKGADSTQPHYLEIFK